MAKHATWKKRQVKSPKAFIAPVLNCVRASEPVPICRFIGMQPPLRGRQWRCRAWHFPRRAMRRCAGSFGCARGFVPSARTFFPRPFPFFRMPHPSLVPAHPVFPARQTVFRPWHPTIRLRQRIGGIRQKRRFLSVFVVPPARRCSFLANGWERLGEEETGRQGEFSKSPSPPISKSSPPVAEKQNPNQ
jgi:hypothetical protein